jgi:transcriptional regulator with XRE-family HTH domain
VCNVTTRSAQDSTSRQTAAASKVSARRSRRNPRPSRESLCASIVAAYRGRYVQTELAARLGVGQNTVSRWSTGAATPSLDDLVRIEEVCDLPRGYILRRAGYVSSELTVPDLIAEDPRLDQERRSILLAAYRAAVRQSNV